MKLRNNAGRCILPPHSMEYKFGQMNVPLSSCRRRASFLLSVLECVRSFHRLQAPIPTRNRFLAISAGYHSVWPKIYTRTFCAVEARGLMTPPPADMLGTDSRPEQDVLLSISIVCSDVSTERVSSPVNIVYSAVCGPTASLFCCAK